MNERKLWLIVISLFVFSSDIVFSAEDFSAVDKAIADIKKLDQSITLQKKYRQEVEQIPDFGPKYKNFYDGISRLSRVEQWRLGGIKAENKTDENGKIKTFYYDLVTNQPLSYEKAFSKLQESDKTRTANVLKNNLTLNSPAYLKLKEINDRYAKLNDEVLLLDLSVVQP